MMIELKEMLRLSDEIWVRVLTAKQEETLRKELNKLGYHLRGWGKLTDESCWGKYKKNTVYNIVKKYREVFIWNYEVCQKMKYKVVDFEDIIIKKENKRYEPKT